MLTLISFSNNIYLCMLVILLPLTASFISGFLGRKLGNSGVQFLTCSSLIISSFLMTYLFFAVGIENKPIEFCLGN